MHVSGTDAAGGDHEGRGFAGVMTAQDVSRLRNILIRRYIDPEPVLNLTLDLQSDLEMRKFDSLTTYTPGGTSTYTIQVRNAGPSPVTGVIIADDLPDGVTMTAPWTCTPDTTTPPLSANTTCNTAPSTTDPISIDVDIAVGEFITVTVPVQFSSNMGDY